MEKPVVTQIETHITHACNLTCESCSHFSNESYSGRETPESFTESIAPWAHRLAPKYFLILGGEPTLNPDLVPIIRIARKLWSKSTTIIIVTNGFFIHKHPSIAQVIHGDNGIRLDISIHHDDPKYLDVIDKARRILDEWGVSYTSRTSFRDWTRIYKGYGISARPYEDNNPNQSWHKCVSKWCMQIHEGRLWKCPPITYLPMHVKKYGDGNGTWTPYLQYKPLDPRCSDNDLLDFIQRRSEESCKMCPANPESFSKSLPMRT
jgi:organic radical activating enzyme